MSARTLVAAVALVVTGAVLPAPVAEADGPAPDRRAERRAPAPAGLAGSPRVVDQTNDLRGYDVAIHAGTAYVGWIGNDGGGRLVHLCVLPPGASACAGGVQTTSAIDGSSAAGLKVLVVGGIPHLYWFHDTPGSVSGPFGGRIVRAAVQSGALQPATHVTNAPSFGELEDVTISTTGDPVVLMRTAPGTGEQLHLFGGVVAGPVRTHPVFLGPAHVEFEGALPVIVAGEAGAVDEPLWTVHHTGTSWTEWEQVPGTWSVGEAYDLVRAGGIRLVAATNNAGFRPRMLPWQGSRFGRPTPTGDRSSCAAPNHDLVTDSSGRLADAYFQCGKVTIVNQPTKVTGARASFNVGGTSAGGPAQIATTGRGLGWAVWGRLSGTGAGLQLVTAPVRLPALLRTRRDSTRGGTVTVKGPVSCLPAVTAPVDLVVRRKSGWRTASTSLRLDGRTVGGSVHGAAMTPGSSHALVGKAVFAKDGARVAATVRLAFRACPE